MLGKLVQVLRKPLAQYTGIFPGLLETLQSEDLFT
jgi:hypothetical protein